eukprot:CAMPEP_0203828558 /NCGR_PEP_ID=MMETSP0115-20131106/61511_1 /ASSEMBLY_ACC=CAM_ASM_000227 /TAXON_ID=33651 /ORGANISM="Bicosoecid sp, Strain ms1" /LENGTH=885 /DNA_ID=CAMNT_0050737617 /DNA_START=75 /DNA_END=2729 /DNA_ORIENTATION=-
MAGEDHTKALIAACQAGNLLKARSIVTTTGVDPAASDRAGTTPLLKACQQGHEAVARWLTEFPNVNPAAAGPRGALPFWAACKGGHLSTARFILTRPGVDVNATDHGQRTPLHQACAMGHLDVAQWLVTVGARTVLSQPQSGGSTPFHAACDGGSRGHLAVAQWLYEEALEPAARADAGRADEQGITPFHAACIRGDSALATIEWLMTLPEVDIEQPDNHGRTPFWNACFRGHLRVAQLLAPVVDIGQPDEKGRTPVTAAAFQAHENVRRWLSRLIADNNAAAAGSRLATTEAVDGFVCFLKVWYAMQAIQPVLARAALAAVRMVHTRLRASDDANHLECSDPDARRKCETHAEGGTPCVHCYVRGCTHCDDCKCCQAICTLMSPGRSQSPNWHKSPAVAWVVDADEGASSLARLFVPESALTGAASLNVRQLDIGAIVTLMQKMSGSKEVRVLYDYKVSTLYRIRKVRNSVAHGLRPSVKEDDARNFIDNCVNVIAVVNGNAALRRAFGDVIAEEDGVRVGDVGGAGESKGKEDEHDGDSDDAAVSATDGSGNDAVMRCLRAARKELQRLKMARTAAQVNPAAWRDEHAGITEDLTEMANHLNAVMATLHDMRCRLVAGVDAESDTTADTATDVTAIEGRLRRLIYLNDELLVAHDAQAARIAAEAEATEDAEAADGRSFDEPAWRRAPTITESYRVASAFLENAASAPSPVVLPWHALEGVNDDTNLVGRGACGVVHRARVGAETTIAVKLFDGALREPAVMRSLHAEAFLLRLLHHDNCVRFLGLVSEPSSAAVSRIGRVGLAMEYMGGGNLHGAYRRYREEGTWMPWPTRLSILCHVARGLRYLHTLQPPGPIAHGDLKPLNVLLENEDGSGRAVIADFAA